MSSEALRQIVSQAIADYGYRQVVMWSPEDVIDAKGLSDEEADLLRDRLIPELKNLPVPVEPNDIPALERRIHALITGD